MRFLHKHAARFAKVSEPMDLDDFVQEGVFGLIRAIEKFDLNTKWEFLTYAYSWVVEMMSRARENKESVIRVPIHIQKDRVAEKIEDNNRTLETRVAARQIVDRVIKELDPRSRSIVVAGLEGQTLQQIGDAHGLTLERVRQIRAEAFRNSSVTQEEVRDALAD